MNFFEDKIRECRLFAPNTARPIFFFGQAKVGVDI